MDYVKTTDKTKAVKKALATRYGAKNVRCKAGTGTASYWIHSIVYRDHVCDLTDPCRDRTYPSNDDCRADQREVIASIKDIARKAITDIGGTMSSFSSDDGYSDSRLDCHSIDVYYKRAEAPAPTTRHNPDTV